MSSFMADMPGFALNRNVELMKRAQRAAGEWTCPRFWPVIARREQDKDLRQINLSIMGSSVACRPLQSATQGSPGLHAVEVYLPRHCVSATALE
eukprot:5061584-Prymnesium_polylepis.1